MRGNTGAAGGIQQESYAAQGHCGFIARPDPSLAFRFPKMYGALHNSNEAATSASRGIAYHTVRLRKQLWAQLPERSAGYPEGAAPKSGFRKCVYQRLCSLTGAFALKQH